MGEGEGEKEKMRREPEAVPARIAKPPAQGKGEPWTQRTGPEPVVAGRIWGGDTLC